MGLAASQARLLLLTAKNDMLELQAQRVAQERTMLAQEQEMIAQEYSDKTTNTVYVCRSVDEKGNTVQEAMCLDSLAKSEGKTMIIADSQGTPKVAAKYVDDAPDKNGKTGGSCEYWVNVDGNMVKYADPDSAEFEKLTARQQSAIKNYYQDFIESMNLTGPSSPLQTKVSNGALQILVEDDTETANDESTSRIVSGDWGTSDGEAVNKMHFVRKAPESLSATTSRYYTEDDAAAQAEYDTAMAKVNALDTRLENKLNQIETQKKAVETEMESVDSLIQSNIERTFKYFG